MFEVNLMIYLDVSLSVKAVIILRLTVRTSLKTFKVLENFAVAFVIFQFLHLKQVNA